MSLLNFFRTTLGLKIIMGVTGFMLFGFVVGHLIGNLQVFLGAATINAYAEFLHSLGKGLWVIRIGLIAVLVTHVWAAVTLAHRNRAARNEQYAENTSYKASVASRTMMITGSILLGFIIFHIFHFTVRNIPGLEYTAANYTEVMSDGETRFDVYNMMISGFSHWWVSALYILGMAALGFHLSHGVASAFRSLGLMTAAYRKIEEYFAAGISSSLVVGYSIIPIMVLVGVLHYERPVGGVEHASEAASPPSSITLNTKEAY
ncbi:MAG: succinate dehydrogenase cytochrome b subunit [Verrucomicrobiota bacterium]